MRKIFTILLCSISLAASAQINNQLPLPVGTVSFILEDRPVHERMHPSVQGSPLLQNDWAEGAVVMADGRNFYGVSLLYNLYEDILYFKRDKEMCEFTDPVKQFMFRYIKGNDSATAVYRSGFPAIGRNTERSFYEVLADGKYQLLNHRYKTLVKVKGDYVRKNEYNKFEDKTQLYLYNSEDKKITRLDNFTDMSAALGAQADSVAGIMGKSKIKMKNENDVIMLVTALNHKK